MRPSLIIASFGAALTALASGLAPVKAEPISHAYPYCLFGRGGGSTTCYFRTREECGGGCVNNPAYVGETRARAILAGAGIAGERGRSVANASVVHAAPNVVRPNGLDLPIIDPGARASVRGGSGFEGWPTDYLMNRFGDHQAQGRF
jgi:hypothetical protein